VLLAWVSCGPAEVHGRSVYWVLLSQRLALLLIVPVPLLGGQPIELARSRRDDAFLPRLDDSRIGRACTSPWSVRR
jgi:hypothetical protein